MSDVKNHKRETTTLLSFIEKPVLKFLASRLPKFITPDFLTITGVVGSFITGLGYYLSLYNDYFLWLASLGLLVNWFGDSLDGTIARFRQIERPKYGFFIDHTLDSISMVVIGIGVGLSPYARFDFVLLALVSYLLISILVYIRTFIIGVFSISYYGFGPTEVRIFIIIVNTLVFYFGAAQFQLLGFDMTILDVAALFFAFVLFMFFIVSVIIDGRKLNLEESTK